MIHSLNSRFSKLNLNSPVQYWLLGGVTLLAVALRFYKLGEWSFWVDEVITVNATRYLNEWPLPRLPLYLVMIRSAMDVFGTSEWSARLMPALIGVISIPLFYFPFKKIFPPAVALLAVLLLAISPWHIYWSQNARFYTLLLLFYGIGSFLFFFGIEKARIVYLLASAFFFVLVIRERVSGFFFVPVILSYLLFTNDISIRWRQSASLKPLAFLAVPAVLYALYDLIRVFAWGENSYFLSFIETFVGEPNQGPLRLLFAIVYRIGIPMIVLGSIGGVYLISKVKRAGWFIVLSAIVPIILLLVLSNFMFTLDRYIFISLPFWAVLTAFALHSMLMQASNSHKFLAVGVIVLVVMTYMGENALYYGYQNGSRANWREALSYVEEKKSPEDVVAATRPAVGTYYLGEKVVGINSLEINTLLQTTEKVWFVIDEDSGYVNPGLHKWIIKNASLSEVIEVSIPGKSFNIRIYYYDPSG